MSCFPYRIVVEWSVENRLFVARLPAFPGLAAYKETAIQAILAAQLAAEAMLEAMNDAGEVAPPSDIGQIRQSS